MSQDKPLLRVGIKKGTFYLSSNTDNGDGWEKQEFKNPQTGEDMVKYHKRVTIKGDIVYLAMRDDKFKGKILSMIVAGEEDSYSLEIPIMNPNGQVKATNEYFNSIVGVLDKLSFGDTVTMFVNSKNKDKKDRLFRNIVVLGEDGKAIRPSFDYKDVPKWASTTTTDDFGEEKTVWNASPANKFYIDLFKSVAERWENERLERKANRNSEPAESTKPSTPAEATPKNAVPTATPNEAFGSEKGIEITDDYDDLPF
jgi:hypothetical protein